MQIDILKLAEIIGAVALILTTVIGAYKLYDKLLDRVDKLEQRVGKLETELNRVKIKIHRHSRWIFLCALKAIVLAAP